MILVYVPAGHPAATYQAQHVLGPDAVVDDPRDATYAILPGPDGTWHACTFGDDADVGHGAPLLDAVYAVLERQEQA